VNFVTPEPIREVGDASALAEAEIAAVLRSLDRRRREAELSPAERDRLEEQVDLLVAELAGRGAGG